MIKSLNNIGEINFPQNEEKSKSQTKKGSLTDKNLETALEREAMSYVKYKVFGENARKNGYEEIARCYEKAAENELAHAILWLDEIYTGSINADLQESVRDENQSRDAYIYSAADAENEGYNEIKSRFLLASSVENSHAELFLELYEKYKSEEMFVSEKECFWECGNCGYIHSGNNPPCKCPLCARGETNFMKNEKKW